MTDDDQLFSWLPSTFAQKRKKSHQIKRKIEKENQNGLRFAIAALGNSIFTHVMCTGQQHWPSWKRLNATFHPRTSIPPIGGNRWKNSFKTTVIPCSLIAESDVVLFTYWGTASSSGTPARHVPDPGRCVYLGRHGWSQAAHKLSSSTLAFHAPHAK